MGRIKPTERFLFLTQHLDLPAATGVPDAKWEHFQLSHLLDDSTFRIETKSRQIAWSWITGAESIAEAILDKRDSIFVSINQEEAKEKIRYARACYECLRIGGLPTLVRDNDLNIELSNGARLTSMPAKPPRGRARSNVYLDEFAHIKDTRKIYGAALPVISKGGRLRIGSSPLGAGGLFWEIYTQAMRTYPGYSRKRTPWWEVQAFCQNLTESIKLSDTLATHERVEMFGTDRIKAIHANMPLEDFQTEYECNWSDDQVAWISWDEIRGVQDEDLLCFQASCRANIITPAIEAINSLAAAIESGKAESVLTGGLDIGRTRNTTELFLVGVDGRSNNYPLRLSVSMDNMEFDDQLAIVSHAMNTLPVLKLLIDQNGIGRNIAENLHKRFSFKAEGVDFTSLTKQLWATDAKMLFQQKRCRIPKDRDLAYQIHSIKRIVTGSNNLVFDTDRNEKHHADMFWALALALSAAVQSAGRVARVIGSAKY